MKRLSKAQRIQAQQKWIEEHGGNLAAYIERYGDPGSSYCYGNGGTAIYEADTAYLRELEAK